MKGYSENDIRSTMSKADFDLYVAKKLISKAKNAKERGLSFEMTYAMMRNVLRSKRCFYTGVAIEPPVGDATNLKLWNLTLDRIDSSKGYVEGNVVACSYAFNQMKERVDSAGYVGMKLMEKAFGKAAERIKAGSN